MKSDPPPGSALIFPWGDRPRSVWRLVPYLLVCTTVLAALALLFKTKTPPPTHSPNISQSILLLDPANPVNQTVLSHAEDRSTLILGPEPVDQSIAGTLLRPVFKPSFNHFQLRLKEPDITRPAASQVRLFQSSDLALPPPSRTPPPNAPPTAASNHSANKPWQLVPKFHGPIASRPLRIPPNLSRLHPQDLAKLEFQIAVKPDGRTLLAIPLNSATEDREILPSLQTALSTTRFEPKPGASTEWGRISFAWTLDPNRSP